MRLLASIVICCGLSGQAHAGALVCPDHIPVEDQTPWDLEKWVPQYSGVLNTVVVARSYHDGKFIQTTIICTRSSGEITMTTRKFCRLVEGDGKTEVISRGGNDEMFKCKPPDRKEIRSKDQICRVL